jgi:hypothetical protein
LRSGLDGANQLEVAGENSTIAGLECVVTHLAISGLTQLSAVDCTVAIMFLLGATDASRSFEDVHDT